MESMAQSLQEEREGARLETAETAESAELKIYIVFYGDTRKWIGDFNVFHGESYDLIDDLGLAIFFGNFHVCFTRRYI